MNRNSELISDLEVLVDNVTSKSIFNPDLRQFNKISKMINSKKDLARNFVQMIKAKLKSRKSPITQLIILELIEFTTCKCGTSLHTEYNAKSFLKIINSIFNQPNLTVEVKEKTLHVIQFFDNFFKNKRELLGNFHWYYDNINSRNIPFPVYERSIYLDMKRTNRVPNQIPVLNRKLMTKR